MRELQAGESTHSGLCFQDPQCRQELMVAPRRLLLLSPKGQCGDVWW